MSRIIKQFAQTIDSISESRAPYDTDGAQPETEVHERRWSEIHALVAKPAFSIEDLPAYLDAIKNANSAGLDDRELLLEKVLVLMSRLKESDISARLQQVVIGLLYKDLPHPPSGYLSVPPPSHPEQVFATQQAVAPRTKNNTAVRYAFRSTDGSNYNPLFPDLGKAGTPYARSVPSSSIIPASVLPDPGLVFDTLLKREKFEGHPDGISSLFFAFADLVIHSIFDTDHKDWTINKTSSYLDLSILYGSTQAQVDSIRRKDGTGKLFEDVFADRRLLFMPPASCALLVLLSRNHNYVAQKLLDINENGTFKDPTTITDPEQLQIQDDELFHRTRLVNCGYFMHIILGDYVGAILGLVRDGSDWRLDPLMATREGNHEVSPRGEGNVVSLEFNSLYRWHATLSEKDTEWTERQFKDVFGDNYKNLTPRTFSEGVAKHMAKLGDVKTWTFGGINRGPDGRFSDDDLARILQNATEWRSGSFRARGTPEVLRVIEIMGIEQGRTWGTCSLNEFRKFIGLRPYKTFVEWNPDPKVSETAEKLYRDINNLELYVGLQAEQAKVPGPGAGLCPGYTISRAILADAVCLTRGDRFLTVDYTPYNLTAWGYQDCQYDKKDGSYGGLLTKLLFRTLPNHYPAGSAYAHFPFTVPSVMKDHMSKDPATKKFVHKYKWTRPELPRPIVHLKTYGAVKAVLADQASFASPYEERLFTVVRDLIVPESIRGPITDKNEAILRAALRDLQKGQAAVTKVLASQGTKLAKFFAERTQHLVKQKTVSHIGRPEKYLDVVKDVINLLPLHWISEQITGLNLKTQDRQNGQHYEQNIYDLFSDVARYVFLTFDPAHDWRLRESAIRAAQIITDATQDDLSSVESVFRQTLRDVIKSEGKASYEFLKSVKDANKGWTPEQTSTYIFAAVVPTSAHFSQALSHVVNFYLNPEHARAKEELVKAAEKAEKGDKEGLKVFMGYVREALRIDPPVSGAFRTAVKDTATTEAKIKAGDHVLVDVDSANTDPAVFGAQPLTASFDRKPETTGIIALGEYGLVSSSFFETVAPSILKIVLSLPDVQFGPGASGKFTRFRERWHQVVRSQFIGTRGYVLPWPDSLVIKYTPAPLKA
ncbi:hypothetical protein AX16_002170 [Volvariella volvacea WC 439]|nr:hypothetical protein AX16_002170 [Volvariella volvacea WC 439]